MIVIGIPDEDDENRRYKPNEGLQMPRVELEALLSAGAHFGHLTRRWNPKMKPYVFMQRNGIHIDRKSTRLNSSHIQKSRMPSSA